ncbi:MAG: hypothetical protein ACLQU4_10595 [Limisphaerales bacterium]
MAAIPEIRVEAVEDEVTYWLPVRPLGILRWFGLVPVGFSVLWLSGVGHMLLGLVRQFSNGKPHGFEYFPVAFLLVFVAVGCLPAGIGILAMFGRCRVRWRDGRLTVFESVGLFGWRRRFPRTAIRKFAVAGGAVRSEQAVAAGLPGAMALLMAQFESGRPCIVAAGYPQEWLEALAAELSARAGRSQPESPRVEVVDGRTNAPAPGDVVDKPADSKVVVHRNVASLVLEVPPAGLRKGSMGLFPFACFWCLFMAVFTAAVVFGKQANSAKGALPPWPFLAVFWSVGLGMMAAAVNLGRRRATFTAGKSGLTVTQSGPFGVKRREFRRGDVAAICTGAGSFTVNHARVPELQIHLVTGKKVGLFAGRDAGELRWLAAELRNAMGVAAQNESITAKPVAGRNPGAVIAILIFVVVGVAAFWRLGGGHKIVAPAAGTVQVRSNSQAATIATQERFKDPGIPGTVMTGAVVFSSFGLSNTYMTNGWRVGSDAHADWFVPPASGRLVAVKLAIEPEGPMPQPGEATVFITKDKRGLPGATLETFPVPAMTSAAADAVEPLVLKSVRQPALKAGVKYWMCVKTSGTWLWHYNNQNIAHNSARELNPRTWATAGDFCRVCAFSILVTTNQQTSTPDN